MVEYKGPFEHIIADEIDWPIARFYRNRKNIVEELTERSSQFAINKYGKRLPQILKQTIYTESSRAKNNPWSVDPPEEYDYWKRLGNELNTLNSNNSPMEDYQKLCKKIIGRYSEEIPGDFNPKTFAFARKFLTKMFGAIYNPWYKKEHNGIWWGKRDEILLKFKVCGPIEKIRKLFAQCSVIVVPTHSSNLDSPLIGYSMESMIGLPAFSYGAGLNLYDYEIAAYYMSRLGAYKIDRRKRNVLYLNTLKEFSILSTLKGLNSVFWPGGTRSRSGQIEKELKYGLLGTLLECQNLNYLNGSDQKIMILPVVVSYHFVLEAESLIEQFLRKSGKEQYIPARKEKKTTMLHLLKRFLKSDSEVVLSFSEPIDVFGNTLDEKGASIANGNQVDIKSHFITQGDITLDRQRNGVYTKLLAQKLVNIYSETNVVLTSQVLTFCIFEMFRQENEQFDIYSLVNLPTEEFSFHIYDVKSNMARLLENIKELERESQLLTSPELYNEVDAVIENALTHLNSFHVNMPIYRSGDQLKTNSIKLLYFYHNRLDGYGLQTSIISPSKAANTLKGKMDSHLAV